MTDDARFKPAWWLPGPHLQAVGARLLRPRGRVEVERERFDLADGDFLDLDWTKEAAGVRPPDDAPIVLALHGLEGSAASDYVHEMVRAMARLGLASVTLNFRSCSGEMNRLARFYHSGDTADAAHVIGVVRSRWPGRALGAVGFSMGGNVLLKHMGECGQHDLKGLEVDAAAAISVPFDLTAGIDTIERGFGRLYQRYFLRRLRRKLRLKADILRDEVDLNQLVGVRTLRAFDDLGTAPLHNFLNSADYYRRSSCKPYLPAIRKPTLLIHAEDDPFQPPEALPRREVAENPHLQAIFTTTGGHVGFVSGPPWAPEFWAESTAASFLAKTLGGRP